MSDDELANIYATTCYLRGYSNVAHPDDDHLHNWIDRLVSSVELAMHADAGSETPGEDHTEENNE